MNYQEKIIAKIETLDVGKPILKLVVNEQYIRVVENNWNANLDTTDFYNKLINNNVERTLNIKAGAYYVDKANSIKQIEGNVLRDISVIFRRCSPAKQPKRTKVYKQFLNIIRKKQNNIELINSIFDIAEYYYQVTQTESIIKPNNSTHRKNIYQLLCLIEKKYGEK